MRGKKGKGNTNPTEVIVTGTDSTQITKPDSAAVVKALTDTAVIKTTKHSPRKATLMSTLLPGLGQVYNRQWWKVPILYAGFGGVIYGVAFNTNYFKDFREAYKIRLTTGNDKYVGKYTNANLEELQQYYRRNRDLCYIIFVGVYVLNILDANVSAHLFDFDVSDDLSMRWQPSILTANSGQTVPALSLSLRFK